MIARSREKIRRKRLPNKLEQMRTEEGIKRAMLARQAGVSDKTISRVEAGEPSTPETLYRLLNALNSLRRRRQADYSFKEVFPEAVRRKGLR